MTLQQYAVTVYFPNIKTKKKPSTYKGYFNLYTKQIQPHIGGPTLDLHNRRHATRSVPY